VKNQFNSIHVKVCTNKDIQQEQSGRRVKVEIMSLSSQLFSEGAKSLGTKNTTGTTTPSIVPVSIPTKAYYNTKYIVHRNAAATRLRKEAKGSYHQHRAPNPRLNRDAEL
jgi:hypothetical protein